MTHSGGGLWDPLTPIGPLEQSHSKPSNDFPPESCLTIDRFHAH